MSPPEKSQSANTVQQAPNDHPEDAPPSYSEPLVEASASSSSVIPTSVSSSQPTRFASIPGILPLDFASYLPQGSSLSEDHVTITVNSPYLLSDPTFLAKFIKAQIALPPKPQIHIVGSHLENGQQRQDFSLKLNMQRYIVRPQNPWNYSKIDPCEESGKRKKKATAAPVGNSIDATIAAWATKFCKDRTDNKSFTINRNVSNWNMTLIDGRIRSLLASLNYRGRISITFPSTHAVVIVQPQTTLYSRLISLMKDAAKYEVVRSVWPYADVADEGGRGNRVCAVQSEDSWFLDWKETVARGALERRVGWLTLDDLMENAVVPGLPIPAREWGGDR